MQEQPMWYIRLSWQIMKIQSYSFFLKQFFLNIKMHKNMQFQICYKNHSQQKLEPEITAKIPRAPYVVHTTFFASQENSCAQCTYKILFFEFHKYY